MHSGKQQHLLVIVVLLTLTLSLPFAALPSAAPTAVYAATWDTSTRLLTEPMLQYPTANSVHVVWYTEFAGSNHTLTYTPVEGTPVTVMATSSKMPRMYEDEASQWRGTFTPDAGLLVMARNIWRHEAVATGLAPNVRVPYMVSSTNDTTDPPTVLTSDIYTLQPLPTAGHGIRILLTSDQQNRPMSPANFQKVIETVGLVDAVFLAGDFVDTPNRASEWFDRDNLERPAFFPAFQGTFQALFPDSPYTGGPILQHAPLFGAIGNHETPGRWRPGTHNLNTMDGDPQPRWYAELRYEQQQGSINPTDDPAIREQWIRDNSFEHIQYFEMWKHPEWTDWLAVCPGLNPDAAHPESYYAYQIGDVFLISMNVSRVWRTWQVGPNDRGKFSEAIEQLNNPDEWGFGDIWFERFFEGTDQYAWLECVLESAAFRNTRYRVVMGHQTMFGLGGNSVPVMADPIMRIFYQEGNEVMVKDITRTNLKEQWNMEVQPLIDAGAIREIRYEYPVEQDTWTNDIEPLLIDRGVQLVLTGHAHVWNRAQVASLHYLETSNVGNSFGAYYRFPDSSGARRASSSNSFWDDLASSAPRWNPANYPNQGDPQGRLPIMPSEFNPERELEGEAFDAPYLSSNILTAFTILDTADGTVSSYLFDTSDPASEVRLFDQFVLDSFTRAPVRIAPTVRQRLLN